MDKAGERVIAGLGLFVLGILLGLGIQAVRAHTPCNDYEQQPSCGYIQAVNPITGELEQHYVCK